MTSQNKDPFPPAPKGFKILLLLLICGSFIFGYYYFGSDESLSEVAKAQLNAIRTHDITKAYENFTSREYQSKYSLEHFRKLVKASPVLADNQSAHFYAEIIESPFGTLTGKLVAADQSSNPVIYRFIQEDGKWKILNLELLDTAASAQDNGGEDIAENDEKKPEPITEEPIYRQELSKMTENLLNAIKNHDYFKAYEDYTSKDFHSTTSFNAFKDFIESYPELTQFTSMSFLGGTVKNGQAKIRVTLTTPNGTYPIDFVLVKENDHWKAWSFRMLNPATPKPKATAPTTPGQPEFSPPYTLENGIKDTEGLGVIVKNLLTALQKQDLDKAYEDFTSKKFKDNTTLEDFREFLKHYPELTQYQSIELGKVSQEGNLYTTIVVLKTDQGISEVEFKLVKEGKDWKIFGISVLVSPTHPKIADEELKEISEVVDGELAALRKGDISKAYYAYTSKEFSKATSIEDFKAFVKSYPILSQNTKDTVIEGIMDGDLHILRVKLISDKTQMDADFQVKKENNKWKIWGIKIYTDTEASGSTQEKENVVSTIKNQLEALKAHDLSKAYYAFASDDFQKNTSEEDFKAFIDAHPYINKHQSFEIKSVKLGASSAQVMVEFKVDETNIKDLEYRLIETDNQWKILSIQVPQSEEEKAPTKIEKFREPAKEAPITPLEKPKENLPEMPQETPPPAPSTPAPKINNPLPTNQMEFSKAMIGTKVDLQGMVINPSTTIKSDKSEITANIYVLNGTKGAVVEVQLEHVETGSKVPPVKITLDITGDVIVTFVFTPPTQGWPEGKYLIHAKSSTGAARNFEFTVE